MKVTIEFGGDWEQLLEISIGKTSRDHMQDYFFEIRWIYIDHWKEQCDEKDIFKFWKIK